MDQAFPTRWKLQGNPHGFAGDAMPLSAARDMGWDYASRGYSYPYEDCPFVEGSRHHAAWMSAYRSHVAYSR